MRFNSFIKWIALTILCGAVAFMGVREYFWLSKEAIDLNNPDVDWSELKAGDHVEMDITYLFDPFVITTSKKGVETMRTFAMPRLESIDSNGYWSITDYIGVHVNNTDLFASYDKLCDETIDWWTDDDAIEYNPTTIHIDGVVREMDSESKAYFLIWSMTMTLSTAQLAALLYILHRMQTGTSLRSDLSACLQVSALLFTRS